MRFSALCLLLSVLVIQLSCTWEQEDDNALTSCEINPPIEDLQSDYNNIMLRDYQWNMGEGIVIDSIVPINVHFSEIGDSTFRVSAGSFDLTLKQSFTSADRLTYSTTHPSPHHWYYVRFDCPGDSCEIDFKKGALGFDERVSGKFRFR